MADEIELRSSDALAFAGISTKAFETAVARGHYVEAPETTERVTRYLQVDDIICSGAQS